MKNLSQKSHSEKKPQSPFSRIVARGHKKVKYKPDMGNLIVSLSSEDHKRIAKVISKWLDGDARAKNS